MYNKIILMGRICHDLELKTTANSTEVLSFRLAVDRSYQAKGEERKTDFINIVAWRNTATFISRYFGKGRMILVEGELQTRQYNDKNNVPQNIVEIIVNNASFTGEAKQQQSSPNGYQNYTQNNQGYQSGYSQNNNQGNYAQPQQPQHPATNTPPVLSQGSTQDFTEYTSPDDDYPF